MKDKQSCPKGGKGVGGQAVIEGVMMRGKTMYALAVRNSKTKEIDIDKNEFDPSKRKKFWSWPLFRGVISFVDSLVTGMKVISKSAEMSGLDDFEEDDEKKSKFDIWIEEKCGEKLTDYLIYFSVFIAIIISIGLFMVLPVFLSNIIRNNFLNIPTWAIGILEGFVRIGIFLLYIVLTAMLKDVKRVFMYHGAEHKTINCFENDEELTVENVKRHSRLHKRCGTSFLLIVMLVSMVVFMCVRIETPVYRVLSRIVLVPVIAGISYEIIKWAGRNDNLLVKIVSAPGMALQLITTKEPEDDMIEVAITALKEVAENEDVE